MAADMASVAASQGRLSIPVPPRRLDDAQRQTLNLGGATRISADLVVRRDEFALLGGFDERFPRAYREDTDFALRLLGHGRMLHGGSGSATTPFVQQRGPAASRVNAETPMTFGSTRCTGLDGAA